MQCKATATKEGVIDFRNTGGTNGSMYGNSLDTPVDIMFCVDKELHIYVIPTKDLLEAGVHNTIRLRIEPTANKQGFQTYKYLK